MSPDDYRRMSGRVGGSAMPSAERLAPSNVTDGRFWGDDDLWSILSQLPAEANTAETAARVSAVNFCCSVIAEGVGSLPIALVDKGLNEISVPLSEVLALEPNHLQTGAEFWAAMVFAGALRGIAFAEPVATFDGIEIWPLDPRRTNDEWSDRSMKVHYSGADGRCRTLLPQQLFWFAGIGDACGKPLVPWKMAKGAIDFQLALEIGGRSFFRNQRRPAGFLATEQKITDEAVLARLQDGVRRWKNGGIPVLEGGLKWESVTGSNADAQLTELIKQRTLEMARYWRIPKFMVGEDDAGKTSSEQGAQDFVKYCARPQGRRIEQAITVRLLPPDMRAAGVRAKLNFDALLRGDSATQWKNAVLARTASVLSTNDIRTDWFNKPRIEEDWADDPRTPLNSNRAADSMSGGETSPQDKVE
jgi:HK97 family phage portal protein